jgi:hypothetical protein
MKQSTLTRIAAGAELAIATAVGYGAMVNTGIGLYNTACDPSNGSYTSNGMCGFNHQLNGN